MKNESVVIERVLNAPLTKVWKAITDNNEMKKWYFDIPEFKAELGFEFQFSAETPDGKKYIHLCKIIEVVDSKKLTYSWRYDGYEGNSLVTFELFTEGNKTRLKLTHEGIESFISYGPAFAKESFTKGWTYIIDESLRGFVE